MKFTVYIVNAFSCKNRGGNPAGVVVGASGLQTSQMQKIAADVGLSETAFITSFSKIHQEIRFFTPLAEVNLCGHATIASYHLLGKLNLITPGRYKMTTRAGEQDIEYQADGLVRMTQNLPIFGPVLPPEPVADCLGLLPKDLILEQEVPVQIASTGLHKIFVPVRSIKRLNQIIPQFDKIERFSRENNTIGMYCYTLETVEKSTAHCRNFAPVVGILEDAATGTSAAALSCVLYQHEVLDQSSSKHFLSFEQGFAINTPARIMVNLHTPNRQIQRVQVAGYGYIHAQNQIDITNG